MIGHTPGPWRINGGLIVTDETNTAYTVAVVGEPNNQTFLNTANARLIAAAPDMYAALVALVDPHGDLFDDAAFTAAQAAIRRAIHG